MVFTGIVTAVGSATYDYDAHQMHVYAQDFFKDSQNGDSVCVNGVCLTIVTHTKDDAVFGVMKETRSITTLGDEKLYGSGKVEVNLEPSLRLGSQLGGHVVSGHVDERGSIDSIVQQSDGSRDIWIRYQLADPPLIHKGSVCIDGVSLTVAEVDRKQQKFRVSLIPHTQSVTTLGSKKVGDHLNIGYDRGESPTNWTPPHKTDEQFMMEAITFAEKGKYTAPPNPWVGCVIVKDGRILGKGYHSKAGTAHAEVKAIADVLANHDNNKEILKGSTVYVTLEPCHHHGRTPPCDQALVDLGVSRVVIATLDPDTRVSGQGAQLLRSAGIAVDVGICEEQVKEAFVSYLHHRITSRPYVVIKAAMSLDGKIACVDKSSQWITDEAARNDAHHWRASSQAIVVGSQTALDDNPRLNVRGVEGGEELKPLRGILDRKGRVTNGHLMDTSLAPTLVFTTSAAPESAFAAWKSHGVEFVVLEDEQGEGHMISLVIQELGKRGILQVLVEGGATLHSEMLKHNMVDRLVLYYGSCVLGSSGRSWTQVPLCDTISLAKFWRLVSVKKVGNSACLEYVRL